MVMEITQTEAQNLTEELLLYQKQDLPITEKLSGISRIPEEVLVRMTDSEKKAFWINMYNGFFLEASKKFSRKTIFKERFIHVGGQVLSLDDIEHGILRRAQWVKGFGFVVNFFLLFRFKGWMVQKLDFRIHFALNCGAAGCPLLSIYHPEKIDQELEEAEAFFIKGDTILKGASVYVSRLFLWYLGDFGGFGGIRALLLKHELLPLDDLTYKIRFSPYDYSPKIGVFR